MDKLMFIGVLRLRRNERFSFDIVGATIGRPSKIGDIPLFSGEQCSPLRKVCVAVHFSVYVYAENEGNSANTVGAIIDRPSKTNNNPLFSGEHCSPLQICGLPFRICKSTYKSKFEIDKLMFVDKLTRTKWREPFLVGRRLGAAENVRFIGCYGGSKPPPYGFVRQSSSPLNQNLKHKERSRYESSEIGIGYP